MIRTTTVFSVASAALFFFLTPCSALRLPAVSEPPVSEPRRRRKFPFSCGGGCFSAKTARDDAVPKSPNKRPDGQQSEEPPGPTPPEQVQDIYSGGSIFDRSSVMGRAAATIVGTGTEPVGTSFFADHGNSHLHDDDGSNAAVLANKEEQLGLPVTPRAARQPRGSRSAGAAQQEVEEPPRQLSSDRETRAAQQLIIMQAMRDERFRNILNQQILQERRQMGI